MVSILVGFARKYLVESRAWRDVSRATLPTYVVYFRSACRLTLLAKPHRRVATINVRYMSWPHRAYCHYCYIQDLRTPWYQDLRTWVGAAIGACLTVFGVFASKEDDDSRVWGLFLGLAILLLVVEFVLIARVNERLWFKPRVEAASAGNEPGGEARV